MTYHPTMRAPLGGVLDSIGTVGTAIKTVAQDPCLFKVAELALTLNKLEQPAAPARPGAPAPPPVKGIGLCSAVAPLNAVIYVRRRPWVLPVAGAALVLGLVGIGFIAGRRSGRKAAR